jgi:probable HAF family extracellular repeat protein
MSPNQTAAILLGLCVGLAACDKTPAGDLAGPEAATLDAAEATTQAAAGPFYAVTHLSKRPGTAHGINRLGQVTGYIRTAAFESHAFLWEGGVFKDPQLRDRHQLPGPDRRFE